MTLHLGALATHPVQYQVPWFRALAAQPGVDLTVYYAMIPDSRQQGVGFGVEFLWDVPLLDGYRHEVLANRAARPSPSRFWGCDTPSIGGILRDRPLDAFLLTGWHTKSSLQGLRACRRAHVPTIVRGDSTLFKRRRLPIRLFHRWLLGQYDAFLVVGRANDEFYAANGVPSSKLFAGPHCVDNDRFAAEARRLRPSRMDIRHRWNVPKDAFVFLFTGKLVPQKRPLDLLEALSRACASVPAGSPAPHLLIVGEGVLRPQIEATVRERGLPVSLVGFLNQSEIVQAYVAADALVLPSDGETWGLVVNEAMACGLPAIVSDHVGCHRDLVTPAETGLVFRRRDVAALADALRLAAADPRRTVRWGENAQTRIGSYSIAKLVAGTLAAAHAVKRSHVAVVASGRAKLC